jgi:hypothetical protein
VSALRRAVAAIGMCCALIGLASTTAATPASAATGPQFSLLAQPAWVPVGGNVPLRLDVPAGLLPSGEDVVLRLRIHNAVETTSAFLRTVNGDRLGNRIDRTYEVPVAQLPRDAQGAVLFTFGLSGSTTTPSFAVSKPGVYPVELALRTDETIASFVTWIVVADPAAPPGETNQVRLASVWSVASAPVLDANEKPKARVAAELEPGGRLADIAGLLDDAGPMPLTLQISPETLESWTALGANDTRLASGAASVKAAAARETTQLLPTPYVPIDITSLDAGGLGTELPDQVREGSDALERLTGVAPTTRTAFVDPIDLDALASVRALLADRIVVRAPSIAGIAADDSLAPFEVAAGQGTARAAATSPLYEELLTSDVSPALRVQRTLAGLSVLSFEHDETPGVVLASPLRWDPDVETEETLLNALRQHPYVRPVTIDDLFATVPAATDDGSPVVHDLAPHDPEPFPISAVDYHGTQSQLASLRSSLGPQDPSLPHGEQALRLSLSSLNTETEAHAYLGVVTDAARALQQGVSTAARRVTVTARRADVPLTFVNDTGKPVTARVHLASEKLLFPDGPDRIVDLAPGETTERFAVEARASGTFTMTVTLASADGNLQLGGAEKISVRSAVFSGAGAALTAGALVILALWWGNHVRRTRRARRAAAAAQ